MSTTDDADARRTGADRFLVRFFLLAVCDASTRGQDIRCKMVVRMSKSLFSFRRQRRGRAHRFSFSKRVHSLEAPFDSSLHQIQRYRHLPPPFRSVDLDPRLHRSSTSTTTIIVDATPLLLEAETAGLSVLIIALFSSDLPLELELSNKTPKTFYLPPDRARIPRSRRVERPPRPLPPVSLPLRKPSFSFSIWTSASRQVRFVR